MRIFVINSGSSSIKFSIYETSADKHLPPACLLDGELNGIGNADAKLEIHTALERPPKSPPQSARLKVDGAGDAFEFILGSIPVEQLAQIAAVGYRVVHPGAKLREHTRITEDVLNDLEEAVIFAPLHNPAVIAVIREGMKHFPHLGHYACFDTTFHSTMPEEAFTYPIPLIYRDLGARRYGFHGLSCESIVRQIRTRSEGVPKRMVIAHLGSGCSATALEDGHSIDTTMGLTPTGGIVMGTRPGDLDPGLLLYLLRQMQGDKDAVAKSLETMLNHDSGMVSLSQLPNDVKALRKAAMEGNLLAVLAFKVFTRSVTKAIGGFCWMLGGLDALVFTGGIGEHDAFTRAEILNGLKGLGIEINSSLNLEERTDYRSIHTSRSASQEISKLGTSIFVIPAQEDLVIAAHVDRLAGG